MGLEPRDMGQESRINHRGSWLTLSVQTTTFNHREPNQIDNETMTVYTVTKSSTWPCGATTLHLAFASGEYAGTVSDDPLAIDGVDGVDYSEVRVGDMLTRAELGI